MKKILLLLITLTSIGFAAYEVKDEKLRTIDSNGGITIAEKTSSGVQLVASGSTGLNMIIRSIKYQVTAACQIYFLQASSSPANTTADSSTYVTMPVNLSAYGSESQNFSDCRVLTAGNNLYVWTSADPNTGWYEVVYDLAKVS